MIALVWALAAPEVLVAHAAQAADLRAPNAEVARVRAEKNARGRAERDLRKQLEERGLSMEKLDALIGSAKVAENFGSDGSVTIDLSVTVDAPAKAHAKPAKKNP